MCLTIQYRWKCGHETYAFTEECSSPPPSNCITTTKTFDKSAAGLAVKAKDCLPCRARHERERKEAKKELARMSGEELKERNKVQNKMWYDKKRERERREMGRVEGKLGNGEDGAEREEV